MSDIKKKILMQGLSDMQVKDNKEKYGTNELKRKEAESIWTMFFNAFDDIWIKVLCAALVLKILLAVLGTFIPALSGGNDVIEIISIILAIALATGFSTLSEFRNSARSEALQEEYSRTFAKVIRNGKLVNILTSEIVKGDTILVQAGDKVPVDGLLFDGGIKVSQAALNGESREEKKIAAINMDEAESTDYTSSYKIFMGSVVTSGEGYMVATVIGDESELGKINMALTDDEEEERQDTSSLKLEAVATGIGKLGVSAAAIAGVLHVVITLIRAGNVVTTVSILLLIAEAVMLMASIVIMAVPEGLPMMNSLVQSMNTESMYKKNILVSYKAAFSDSAYMNVLFSDKTGTITQGNLSLVEFITGDGKIVDRIQNEEFIQAITLNNLAKICNDRVVLMAVLCLRDDVRTDAIETVEVLNRAGIQVVMVTGDAEETAVAIAKEAGILTDEKNDVVLTHDELEKLSDQELKKLLPHLKVVSRAKPLDKKRLVVISQQLDNVCGMTGDGVNDAPALKQADIGFAMGDGTAVAQEAGDVVILNNSLTSIKDCVLNSRTMAKSVGKFLIFQLTVNISTLLMNIIAPILGWTEPFSIVQILWINLIMDTLAAMAFGGEPILDRYMDAEPAKRTDNILTTYIKSSIAISSIFITVGSILILENIAGITSFVTPDNCVNPELYKKTFMFAFFIYAIIFNSLNTRSEKYNLFEHIQENKNFIRVMGTIFVLQTIIIEIGGKVFETTMLDGRALLVSMGLAILIIPVDLIRKAVVSK